MKKRITKAQKYLQWEKPNQAIAELRILLKDQNSGPEYAWIPHHMMGIALSQKADHHSSAGYFEKAIEKGSSEPETYHMLSVNYYHLGRFEKAEKYGREAVERKANFLKAWLNLGSVYRAQARLDEALACYKKANRLDPKNAGVAFRIGEIYRDQGDLEQAGKLFDITLKIDSAHQRAILEKADIHKKKGNYIEAEKWLAEAKAQCSDATPVEVSEAELYKSQGDYDRAIALYKDLLERHPRSGAIRVNYALCLQEVSRFEQSEEHYRRAIEDMKDPKNAISNYLMGLHYNPDNRREYIFKEHIRLGKAFIPGDTRAPIVPSSLEKDKRLKIGFVSGGFRRHPVGWMIAGALEQLPEDHFELYCYTTNNKYDFVTRRIHKHIDVWRSVVGYTPDVIESLVREDELDILVDLSGHSGDNCLDVMARKPAPVIVKWVGGLFNTTGLEAFDYLISDWHESPAGDEPYYTEKLVRMPDDYITFTPPAYAPEVGELSAKENGYITFGCFNNPTKVNRAVLKRWAEVMQKVSGSRLLLKSKQYDTPSFRDQITAVMEEQGISHARIEFEGHTSHDAHLEAYNRIDIALDPWPYSGGLTTCEALYMGNPVVTLPGPTFAGRHSATHLINAGLPQWVTESWDEYTEKAVGLANNLVSLQTIREELREQLLQSPVCDGQRFGAHLSIALRRMWEQRVDGYNKKVEKWQQPIEVEPLPQKEIEKLTDGPAATPPITIEDEDLKISKTANKSHNIQSKDMQPPTTAAKKGITKAASTGRQSAVKQRGNQRDKTNDFYSIETKDGVTVCTPADLDMLTPYVLLEQEQWYEPELDFVRQYLQPGMQVVDAGASFGAYALPMAKKVGGGGAVYAFEPGALAGNFLETSKSENGFGQLEVVKRGLGKAIGKAGIKKGQSPEFNTLQEDEEGEIAVTTLDAWWTFAGRPGLDLVKIDVNGMEASVLQGAAEILEAASPLILASVGEHKDSLQGLRGQLAEMDYVPFEYIPGPGLLAGHEPEAGVDSYLANIVAIPRSRVEEFKEQGWIFDDSATIEQPGKTLWKETLQALPWADSQMDSWEEEIASGTHEEYLQALDLICAAEQVEASAAGGHARSRKGAALLAAAQILIGLFNSGKAGISAAMTYVRLMNQLGRRGQAVEMMKELMETVNSGKEVQARLPFLPPLPGQDGTGIQTDFTKWLTVRIVEAWITLKTPSTYMSGKQEKQMLKALEGNPEVSKNICKSIVLTNNGNTAPFDFQLNSWFWYKNYDDSVDYFTSPSIDLIDVRDKNYQYSSPGGVAIIMPCIDKEQGIKTANILVQRAGMSCKVIITFDSAGNGFMDTLNAAANKIDVKYIVYLAQDAYPGMYWLKKAYEKLEKTGKGLLAFNDAKWNGVIASFGMVRVSWVREVYDDAVLYPEYKSHCADDELTAIAHGTNQYVYDPNITLIEVDYNKGLKGGGNKQDRKLFYDRFRNGFNGKAPMDKLKEIAGDYNIPRASVKSQKLHGATFDFKSMRPVIIAGMHRSGTSLLTRILDDLGIFVGADLSVNHESKLFQKLNVWIFKRFNSRWDEPPQTDSFIASTDVNGKIINTLENALTDSMFQPFLGRKENNEILTEHFSWGWKDPRNVFTLPFWLNVFPKAKVVFIERNGIDVANSLKKRTFKKRAQNERYEFEEGLSSVSEICSTLEGGYRLWEEYMDEAEKNLAPLSPDQLLKLTYEDLLYNKDKNVSEIVAFLGLDKANTNIAFDKSRAHAYKNSEALKIFANEVSNT